MATETSTSAAAGSGAGNWVESYTGMSTDNIKGLVLALSSSVFIGTSFIVKKKGLRKAGASGVRAGDLIALLTIQTSLICLLAPHLCVTCVFWLPL
jgi:hypothetical protein